MISLKRFQSLSHKEAKCFHIPQLRGLDWDLGSRWIVATLVHLYQQQLLGAKWT